ncbi:DUF2809 domain-containing protein [Microbacterium sp. P05]|uniref:ribosomal maturation YjgA family protein n=1 Tax=Microbacterium sp. P05 TaxID=3366948 RepID=UPI003746E515
MFARPPVGMPPRGRTRRRLWALVALAALVAVGLFLHGAGPASTATDIAGDALYAVAIYTGLVVLAPAARRSTLVVIASVWCVAVELFQLTGLPRQLGAAFAPAALVLGSGFSARDLVVYVAAIGVAGLVDGLVRRRSGMSSAVEGLDPS